MQIRLQGLLDGQVLVAGGTADVAKWLPVSGRSRCQGVRRACGSDLPSDTFTHLLIAAVGQEAQTGAVLYGGLVLEGNLLEWYVTSEAVNGLRPAGMHQQA